MKGFSLLVDDHLQPIHPLVVSLTAVPMPPWFKQLKSRTTDGIEERSVTYLAEHGSLDSSCPTFHKRSRCPLT